jgi:hypothetical protein
MFEIKNEKYKEEVIEAITVAIFSVAKKHAIAGTPVLLMGEAIEACIMNASYIAGISKVCDTNQGIRKVGEWCGKKVRTLITIQREEFGGGCPPNWKIHYGNESH